MFYLYYESLCLVAVETKRRGRAEQQARALEMDLRLPVHTIRVSTEEPHRPPIFDHAVPLPASSGLGQTDTENRMGPIG